MTKIDHSPYPNFTLQPTCTCTVVQHGSYIYTGIVITSASKSSSWSKMALVLFKLVTKHRFFLTVVLEESFVLNQYMYMYSMFRKDFQLPKDMSIQIGCSNVHVHVCCHKLHVHVVCDNVHVHVCCHKLHVHAFNCGLLIAVYSTWHLTFVLHLAPHICTPLGI